MRGNAHRDREPRRRLAGVAAARPSAAAPAQRLAIAALALALAFAFRRLWSDPFPGAGPGPVEAWLFLPDHPMRLPALATTGWLFWRRRGRLRHLPAARAPLLTALFGVPGIAAYLLACRSGSADLLLVSLSLLVAASAAAARGRAGLQIALGPAAVLWLGCDLPAPLTTELVWQLQLAVARDAAALLERLGVGISAAGVMLWRDRVSFQVVEACSGYQTVRTLLLVAVIVCELFARSGRRLILLVLAAPFLAYLLNVVRVALAAWVEPAGPVPASADDHTLQGLAVIAAGAALLYAAGKILAATAPVRGDRRAEPGPTTAPNGRASGAGRALPIALASSALLLLLSVGTGPVAAPTPTAPGIGFARVRPGWQGSAVSPTGPDLFFFGDLPWERVVYRRYVQDPRRDRTPVEVFITPDGPGAPAGGRFFTSKLRMPGADWAVQDSRPLRIPLLGADGEISRVVRGRSAEAALVYSWRVRDPGVFTESLRAMLAALGDPLPVERPRVAIRVAAPLRGAGPLAEARARKTLERFVNAFRDELAAL